MNPDLSVVVPIYNEELGISEFAQQLKSNLDDLKIKYEVIFINDGSTDSSQRIINSPRWTSGPTAGLRPWRSSVATSPAPSRCSLMASNNCRARHRFC